MKHTIGIRREDKNPWEARVPITPDDAKTLIDEYGLDIVIQPSSIRIFDDRAFSEAGVRVAEDLDGCSVVIAVKEIPKEFLKRGRTYICFSHTIKGQSYNMEMLKRFMELDCQLIDYETVVDDLGRRLIFFGRHAGLAGMIDTLWALGRRLEWEGISPNPFAAVEQAHRYRDLEDVKEKIARVGNAIKGEGLSERLCPMLFGFAGYGNVSQGAQEILDLLPVESVAPEEAASLFEEKSASRDRVYKTEFHEKHLVVPREEGVSFELQDYYDNPEKYRSRFGRYLPFLSVLVNCIYWEEKYPRLVTLDDAAGLWALPDPRLRVVGDISCDPGGSIEFLLKTTTTDNPVFVYDPETGKAVDGVAGKGPVVLGVDNLPCELALESSHHFSKSLKPFVHAIASADFAVSFEKLALPAPIKRAMILHHGELTPRYSYMEKFIS